MNKIEQKSYDNFILELACLNPKLKPDMLPCELIDEPEPDEENEDCRFYGVAERLNQEGF